MACGQITRKDRGLTSDPNIHSGHLDRSQAEGAGPCLGTLDAPDQLMPTYELWITRRESWLPQFPFIKRYAQDHDALSRHEG
jgi:hypothetical protein